MGTTSVGERRVWNEFGWDAKEPSAFYIDYFVSKKRGKFSSTIAWEDTMSQRPMTEVERKLYNQVQRKGYTGLAAVSAPGVYSVDDAIKLPMGKNERYNSLICKILGYLPITHYVMGILNIGSGICAMVDREDKSLGARLMVRGVLEFAGYTKILLIADLAVTAFRIYAPVTSAVVLQ